MKNQGTHSKRSGALNTIPPSSIAKFFSMSKTKQKEVVGSEALDQVLQAIQLIPNFGSTHRTVESDCESEFEENNEFQGPIEEDAINDVETRNGNVGLVPIDGHRDSTVPRHAIASQQISSSQDIETGDSSQPADNPPRRGRTKCLKWKRKRNASNFTKVCVQLPANLRRVVGDNAQQFITEASLYVKYFCPLNVEKWKEIPYDKKVKLLQQLKDLFNFPNEAWVDKAILKQCKRLYSSWHYHLKKETYEKHVTLAARLNNCPDNIDPEQWHWVVTVLWNSDKARKISEINRANALSQKMRAKVGTKSIARIYHDMGQTTLTQNYEEI